jgi:hypothetical protein
MQLWHTDQQPDAGSDGGLSDHMDFNSEQADLTDGLTSLPPVMGSPELVDLDVQEEIPNDVGLEGKTQEEKLAIYNNMLLCVSSQGNCSERNINSFCNIYKMFGGENKEFVQKTPSGTIFVLFLKGIYPFIERQRIEMYVYKYICIFI